MAFASRFQITCCSRIASPLTVAIGRLGANDSVMSLASASGPTASTAIRVTATRSICRGVTCSVPETMRETSSRSSMMCASAAAFRSIDAIARLVASGLVDASMRASRARRSAACGSCETVANSSFRWLASTASSVIACARASGDQAAVGL
jgi:hypothetical protein